jgi:hypothetical protein
LTVDTNAGAKFVSQEMLQSANRISSCTSTKNGAKSGNSIRTYYAIGSEASATLKSDDSVFSARTKRTIRSNIMAVMAQQVLNTL